MRLPNDTIVLVADGSRMLLLRNHGDDLHPDLRVISHREIDNPPNRELLADAPGVGFSSTYRGRDTFSKSEPHQAVEDCFAAEAVAALARVAKCASSGLVVVAPPHALGEMRKHYNEAIRKCLVAEIDRDLLKHPVDEITRHLSRHGEASEA